VILHELNLHFLFYFSTKAKEGTGNFEDGKKGGEGKMQSEY